MSTITCSPTPRQVRERNDEIASAEFVESRLVDCEGSVRRQILRWRLALSAVARKVASLTGRVRKMRCWHR